MLLILITKCLTTLAVITALSNVGTNAQLFNLNILSFNSNRAGNNSLNGNANAVATSSASQGSQAQAQAQDHPFGSWYSALSSGLNYLFGTSSSRFEYPHLIGNITKYLFGGETTNVRDRSTTWYTGPYDYYNPYYYYPFNYDHFNLYRG